MENTEAEELIDSGEEEEQPDDELEEGEDELLEGEDMQPDDDEGEEDEEEVEGEGEGELLEGFEDAQQEDVSSEEGHDTGAEAVAVVFGEDQEEEESQEESQQEDFFNTEDTEGEVEEGALHPKSGSIEDLPESGDGDGEVPPGSQEEITLTHLLATDNESLYDPGLGYGLIGNVREEVAFQGFTTAFQDYFFPLIDSQSGVLFEIVQGLERAVYKSNEDILRGMKEPVAIPTSRLVVKAGGPEIRLRIMDPSEPMTGPGLNLNITGVVKSSHSPSASGMQKILKTPDLLQLEKQITPAEKAFSPEKLDMLMKPFEHGWKREIVIRSHGGSAKKLGDVYYFNPQGVKFRSSKQVAVLLSKLPQLNMSADNFSFAKARVSYDPEHETVRAAHGGRGLNPVKNAQQRQQFHHNLNRGSSASSMDEEDSNGLDSEGMDSSAEEVVKARGGKRSIQPPKRYVNAEFLPEPKRAKMAPKASHDKDMSEMYGGMQMGTLPPKYRGMEEEKSGEQLLQEFRNRRGRPSKAMGAVLAHHTPPQYLPGSPASVSSGDDGPMFGISALTQGSPFSNYHEGYGSGAGTSGGESEGGYEADVSLDAGEEEQGELLPCSIRCPGQTGEIPTLQCKRCLCLYHPGCLGLPNQSYRNFLCSNCEGENSSAESGDDRNSPLLFHPMKSSGGGLKMLKRPEPPALRPMSGMMGGMRRILPKMPGLQQQQQQPVRGQMQPRMPGFPRLNPPPLMRTGMGGMEMRRGRGRPRMMVPQLNSRSVTITPISLPRQRGPAPVVPRLQPMSVPQGYRGGMMRGRGGGPGMIPQRGRPPKSLSIPRGGPNPQMNFQWQQQQQQQQMMMRRPTGQIPIVRQRVPSSLSVMAGGGRGGGGGGRGGIRNSSIFRVDPETGRVMPNPNAMGGLADSPQQRPPPNQFHRYAQSVVTIKENKYIAVPKNSSASMMANQSQNQVKPQPQRLLKRPVTLQEFLEQTRKERAAAKAQEYPEDQAANGGGEGGGGGDVSGGDGESASDIRTNGVNSAESTDSAPERDHGTSLDEVSTEDEKSPSKQDMNRALSLVFENLNTVDKLRCRTVSHLWYHASVESSKDILSLENARVTNWTLLKDFIVRYSVSVLDTRGAVIQDMEEFWQQLLSLDYEVATTEKKPLEDVIITQEVANWADGTLLQEFEDTGRCKIIIKEL